MLTAAFGVQGCTGQEILLNPSSYLQDLPQSRSTLLSAVQRTSSEMLPVNSFCEKIANRYRSLGTSRIAVSARNRSTKAALLKTPALLLAFTSCSEMKSRNNHVPAIARRPFTRAGKAPPEEQTAPMILRLYSRLCSLSVDLYP